MEITEVRIFPVSEGRQLKATVNITFDDCFRIYGLKIIQGTKGWFVQMPNQKLKSGRYKDIVTPVNRETRQMIEDRILAEYEKVTGKRVARRKLET